MSPCRGASACSALLRYIPPHPRQVSPFLGWRSLFLCLWLWVLPWRSCSVAPLSLRLIPRIARQASPLKREGKALHSPRGFVFRASFVGLLRPPPPLGFLAVGGPLPGRGLSVAPSGQPMKSPPKQATPFTRQAPKRSGNSAPPQAKPFIPLAPGAV